jgi:hypothetical protein
VDLERIAHRPWRKLAPNAVDDRVDRHDAIALKGEQREDRPLLLR